MVVRAVAALLVAAVVYAVGQEAPTERPGVTTSPAPGLPTYQPAALFPDRVADAGKAIKETGETVNRVETQQVSFPLREHDPLYAYVYDPGFTLPTPAPPPEPLVQAAGALSEGELDHYAALAGWPNEPGWWPEMKLIIGCESGGDPNAHNGADPNGGSSGLTQLNGRSHFDKAGEDFAQRYDPVVNLRTALWLRTVRGHFGGSGGWKNCAAKFGIE